MKFVPMCIYKVAFRLIHQNIVGNSGAKGWVSTAMDNTRIMNNYELVQAIKEEVAASEQTRAYNHLKGYIFRKLSKKVEDKSRLEDLFQEGYMKLRVMLLFKGLVCKNVEAYLYMIVRNLWLAYIRNRDRQPRFGRKSLEDILREIWSIDPNEENPEDENEVEWPDDVPGAAAPPDDNEPDSDPNNDPFKALLMAALEHLKPANAEFIRQYYLSDPPIALKDIKILEKSPGTAYRNYENLKKLKQRTTNMLCKIFKKK